MYDMMRYVSNENVKNTKIESLSVQVYNELHCGSQLLKHLWYKCTIWSHMFLMIMTRITQIAKVHGANMGPTWVLSAPAGPHVGPMNFAIREQNRILECADVLWVALWESNTLASLIQMYNMIRSISDDNHENNKIESVSVQVYNDATVRVNQSRIFDINV